MIREKRHHRLYSLAALLAVVLPLALPAGSSPARAASSVPAPVPPAFDVSVPGAVVTGVDTPLSVTLTNPAASLGGTDQPGTYLTLFFSGAPDPLPAPLVHLQREVDGAWVDVPLRQADVTYVIAELGLPALAAGSTQVLRFRERLDPGVTLASQYTGSGLYRREADGSLTALLAEERHRSAVGSSDARLVGLDDHALVDPGAVPRPAALRVYDGGAGAGPVDVRLTVTGFSTSVVPGDVLLRPGADPAAAPVAFTSDGSGGVTAVLARVDLTAGYDRSTPYLLSAAPGPVRFLRFTTSLVPAGGGTPLASSTSTTGAFGPRTNPAPPDQVLTGRPIPVPVLVGGPATNGYARLRLRLDLTPPAGTRPDQVRLTATEPDGGTTALAVADQGGGVLRGEAVTAWTAPLPPRAARQVPVTLTFAQGAPHGTLTMASALVDDASGVELARSLTRSTTLVTVPAAPPAPALTASPGGLQVGVGAPTDDGGSPVTGYVVTAAQSGRVTTVTGTGPVLTVAGLDDREPARVTVSATNAAGAGTAGAGAELTPGLLPSAVSLQATPGTATVGSAVVLAGSVARLGDGAVRVDVPVHVTARRADGLTVDMGSPRTDASGQWTATIRSDASLLVTASALGTASPQVPVTVGAALTRLTVRRTGRAASSLTLSARVTAAGASPVVDVVLVRGASVLKVLRSGRGAGTRDGGTPSYFVTITAARPPRGSRVALRVRATAVDGPTLSRVTAF